jgi:hypothetical protein
MAQQLMAHQSMAQQSIKIGLSRPVSRRRPAALAAFGRQAADPSTRPAA